DDPAVFLADAGQEAGDVDEGEKRDVEGVAEAYEARPLLRGADVEGSGQRGWLVADDPDGVTVHAGEPDDDVGCPTLVDLEELTVVDDGLDDLDHVVGLIGGVGDDGI